MALTNLPTAQLSFKLRDASGSIGRFVVHVPYATLAAAAITAADAISAAVALITGCVVLGYELTYAKNETAPGTPTTGSRVEDKGVFVWRTANGRTTRFEIPGIVDAVLNPDGSIDRTNADIIALDAVVTGVGAIFAGADGSDITSLLEAYQRFNATKKRQMPANR
jgi:hypothetical protein